VLLVGLVHTVISSPHVSCVYILYILTLLHLCCIRQVRVGHLVDVTSGSVIIIACYDFDCIDCRHITALTL